MFHTRFHWAIGGIVLLIILLCGSRNAGFLKFNIENEIDVGFAATVPIWSHWAIFTYLLFYFTYLLYFTYYFIMWS